MQRLRLSSFLLVASRCSEHWILRLLGSVLLCEVMTVCRRFYQLLLINAHFVRQPNSKMNLVAVALRAKVPICTKTVWLDWNDLLCLAKKSVLAGDTATPDPFHCGGCMRERCACVDHLATASGGMKGLYQKVWQCERLVAGFEVDGLITLQRDWFRFRGCPGLWRRTEERRRKRREKAGRGVRRADNWARSEKGMEEFQFRFKSNTITTSAPSALATVTPTGCCRAYFYLYSRSGSAPAPPCL